MLKGIILAVLEDVGPSARINLSNLTELESMKLAVAAITAIGMGNESPMQRGNLFGTFPVSNRDERALVFPFAVSGELSKDKRVNKFGRECSIVLLFEKSFREEVLQNFAKIEDILRSETAPLYSEDNLTEVWLKKVLSRINEIYKSPTTSEMNNMKALSFPDAAKSYINEVIRLQKKLDEELTLIGVGYSDNPILEMAFEPQIANLEQENKLLTTGQELLDTIDKLEEQSELAVRHYVDIAIIEKLGHYFYWHAIRTQSLDILKVALKYYNKSLDITESGIMLLTIASIKNKLADNNNELARTAKEELKEGFEKYDKRLKIFRQILFATQLEEVQDLTMKL